MPRIDAINPKEATGKAKELLEGVQAKMGMAPNILRTMAQSPCTLEAYLGFSTALQKGKLGPALREQIALGVSEANGCEYCVSAHAALGKMAGLSEEDISDSRRGTSVDRKSDAALQFVHQMVEKRGWADDKDFEKLHSAGFGDEEIVEIVANVALNLFTNYFNHVAGTEIDFPKVSKLKK